MGTAKRESMKAFCDKHYTLDAEGKKVFNYPTPCRLCLNPFYDEIWRMVFRKNRNVLIMTEGEPGTGKSYRDLGLAAALDPGFNVNTMGKRILFSVDNFINVLNEKQLYKGAAIMIEEGGIQADHHKWFSFNNMCVNYILQTFRFMNLIVNFNVPIMDYIDSDTRKMFKFHIETLDVRDNMCICKIKKQKYNSTTHKIYRSFLKYKVNGEIMQYKLWKFKKPPAILCHKYEELHIPYKTELLARLGSEMKAMSKKAADESNKTLFNEGESMNFIVANKDKFGGVRGGKFVLKQPLIETYFGIGRFRAGRLKAGAEMRINAKPGDI
jgi:hypothetical protein